MNLDGTQTNVKSPCSPADALAMKNAALRAVLGYLEHKQGHGDWPQDELACRFHRMVELALEAPCEFKTGPPSRFVSLNHPHAFQS